MNLLLVSLSLIAVGLLYRHLTRNYDYWKKRNVPYLKPILLFGNAWEVFACKASIGEFVRGLYQTTTSQFQGFFILDQPVLFVRDPELCKCVLIKDVKYFDERSNASNQRDDPIGSSMLLLLKNPEWKSVKSIVSPIFSAGKVKTMFPLIDEHTHDLLDFLKSCSLKQESTDCIDIAQRYTTDAITSCAFGIKSNAFLDTNDKFREVTRRLINWSMIRKFQMACYFFAPILVKLFKMKFVEPTAGKFMAENVAISLRDRKISNVNRGDVIDILIQIEKKLKETRVEYDPNIFAAQAIQFFFAGFESTANAISFTLYELALNPTIQERARSEIIKVLQKHDDFTYESLHDMSYLDMILAETLRKYPLLPFLDRRCTKDYKIPGTEVVIEKGVPVYISVIGIQYDPKYYPDPETFDPERFTNENKNARPSSTYMPFGDGPRKCPGARYGITVAKIALVRILRNFSVEQSQDTPIPLTFSPSGFTMILKTKLIMRFKQISF